MTRSSAFRWVARLRDESAQVLPWMVLLIALFIGVGGLCIDLGRGYIVQRELQASTDAAALAGGYELGQPSATTSTVKTAAQGYSSYSASGVTALNATGTLPSVTFTPALKCLTTLVSQGIQCTGAGSYNAIQITQTATISTFFIQALNIFKSKPMTSMTISTTSTAAMRGAGAQYNVVLLIDTTASMGPPTGFDSDASCNNYRINCALTGVQTLLQSLTPCTASSTSTSCTGFDNVSIFTFPNIQANTAQYDYDCSSTNPTAVAYSTPSPTATYTSPTGSSATYQVTGFLDDYSSTNQSGGALNSSSILTKTANGKSGCTGMQTPGGEGTYFAGAIYAALSALKAEQLLNPGSKNALIILSDGSATSTKITATSPYTSLTSNGTYPSAIDQCHQAVTAAGTASSTTTVYSVAYGASSATSDCSTDSPGITPCATMQQMATASVDFYSDATATQNSGQCTSTSNPNLTLNNIFKAIGSNLAHSRLIPNNTT